MTYEKPVFPGPSTKRKLHGGPWHGETIGFREDQPDLRVYRPVLVDRQVRLPPQDAGL